MNTIAGSLSSRALENHRNLVIRFFVGAWSISCFVLVTAYSSVLISFLTAPADTFIPLVNSVNDLLNKTNVRVTVNKGLIADTLIKVTLIYSLGKVVLKHNRSSSSIFAFREQLLIKKMATMTTMMITLPRFCGI